MDEPEDSTIKKLGRELYAREESPEIARRRLDLSSLGSGRKVVQQESEHGEERLVFADVMAARARKRRKVLLGIVVGGVAAAIIAGAVGATIWYRLTKQVKQEQIQITISAPTEITAGDEVTYTVSYKNESRVAWQNVEVTFEQPVGFLFTSSAPQLEVAGKEYIARIGTITSGQEGQLSVAGRLVGEQNAVAVARAEIVLTPENFPSGRFSQAAVFNTTIASVPVDVSIEAAADAASGERVLAVVRVRNVGASPVSNAYVHIQPAPGMQLAVEDTQFSPEFSVVNSLWELPVIEPLQEVEKYIVVYVEGGAGERRTLEVEAGIQVGEDRFVQRRISHVVTVSASELTVEQIYNGSSDPIVVKAGQEVQGVVRYKNVGTVGLKNVIVEVQFEGVGLDPATLQLEAGAYDPIARKITWSSATVSELATVQPQQERELPYAFKILPTASLPTQGEATKNLNLISTAAIDSPDLPAPTGQERKVVSDRAILSIGTDLTLEVASFYDDGRLGIVSSGPLPPKVGQQTTYTVRLRLGTTVNDVGDARVVAVLPDGVKYTDKTYLTGGTVDFNDRTGEVTWLLPLLPGLSGRTTPPQELHFQVAATPAEHQKGDVITFLNRLTADGTDLFTDQAVNIVVENYPTTETAAPKQGKVE